MKIVELDKPSRIIHEPYISWIRDQKLILETPIDVMAKIWSGAYKVYIAMDHIGHPQGMIVCRIQGNTCMTVLVHAKNQLLKLRADFYELLKTQGIEKVQTYSHERSKAYERLISMTHVYSYYEKEL